MTFCLKCRETGLRSSMQTLVAFTALLGTSLKHFFSTFLPSSTIVFVLTDHIRLDTQCTLGSYPSDGMEKSVNWLLQSLWCRWGSCINCTVVSCNNGCIRLGRWALLITYWEFVFWGKSNWATMSLLSVSRASFCWVSCFSVVMWSTYSYHGLFFIWLETFWSYCAGTSWKYDLSFSKTFWRKLILRELARSGVLGLFLQKSPFSIFLLKSHWFSTMHSDWNSLPHHSGNKYIRKCIN